MGEVVVAQGLLSRENLDRATAVCQLHQKRLGEALLELGIVDRELLEDFLGLHVIAILTRLFSWRDGSHAFEEEDPAAAIERDFTLKQTTAELILEAARAVSDREIILFALGNLDRVLLASSDPRLRFQRVALGPTDAFVLSRVDGTTTASEVVQITPLAPEAVEQSLLALVCTGMVEFASQKPPDDPASPQFLRPEILKMFGLLSSSTPYELLGVAPDSTDAEIKAAYFRLAKRFHPDAHHQAALADLEEKLERIFIRLREAYEQISTPQGRTAYQASLKATTREPGRPSPSPPAVSVEEMFERAKERFGEGKYWESIALFEEVVRAAEIGLRTQARFLLAKALLKYPEKERDAERELLEVVRADPSSVESLLLLGELYKRRQHSARAEATFRKVLELKPNDPRARAYLQREAQAAPAAKGLLKKLLGKE
jgi:curved DNA-binding protein CbpA